jgi:hypothetical protein
LSIHDGYDAARVDGLTYFAVRKSIPPASLVPEDMMSKKRYTDSVSLRPRVTASKEGVIDIAGLMAAMTVEEAVREATAALRGETGEGQATSEIQPGNPTKHWD